MTISGLESINDIILIVQWKHLEKANSRNLNVFSQHSNCEAEISFHLYTFTKKDNEFEKSETAINRFTRT